MLKFMNRIGIEPKLTQKEISKQLRLSDSTIKRYRNDINMDSPYNRSTYRKKNDESNTPKTQYQSHTTSEKIENNEKTKNNK